MSDLGIHSFLYDQTREVSRLLDDVILQIHAVLRRDDAAASTISPEQLRLADILDARHADIRTATVPKTVGLILRGNTSSAPDVIALALRLRTGAITKSDLGVLETLARTIELEQAEVAARIQAWTR